MMRVMSTAEANFSEPESQPNAMTNKKQKSHAHKMVCLVIPFFRLVFGQHRDKGRGHRPLSKELPEKVRNAEGYKKYVRRARRSKETRENHIADKTKNAADEGRNGHHARRPRDLTF